MGIEELEQLGQWCLVRSKCLSDDTEEMREIKLLNKRLVELIYVLTDDMFTEDLIIRFLDHCEIDVLERIANHCDIQFRIRNPGNLREMYSDGNDDFARVVVPEAFDRTPRDVLP